MEAAAHAHHRSRLEIAEVERVEVETLLYLRVRREHGLKASIKQEPIYGVGPHAAADSVGCLEHLTPDTSSGQILRTHQASETRTNDHDVSHNNPHRSDPAHISHSDPPPSAWVTQDRMRSSTMSISSGCGPRGAVTR
jgi:hypothetical protein